jgi:ABC-type transport system involved in cytochrome bd biosynthesis fused ATPase/permease subunit
MTIPVIPSTAFLTVLLSVGLFFFIRASTKDRTEVIEIVTAEPEESFLGKLQTYFLERAYRVSQVEPEHHQVVFEGVVRPSTFLAIFLTSLAAIGILCLTLVLSILFPNWTQAFIGLVVLAPMAGLFYWTKAGRKEQVSLQIETLSQPDQQTQTKLTVTAHRDELAELQRYLKLTSIADGSLPDWKQP